MTRLMPAISSAASDSNSAGAKRPARIPAPIAAATQTESQRSKVPSPLAAGSVGNAFA